jgi:hypothetical protein
MAKAKKYNLTVIDQTPEITNFVYRGITESDKAKIIAEFHDWKKKVTEESPSLTTRVRRTSKSITFTAWSFLIT